LAWVDRVDGGHSFGYSSRKRVLQLTQPSRNRPSNWKDHHGERKTMASKSEISLRGFSILINQR
ncbi:hypothetical protein PENTCL1PPCAC_15968, partial [Pristionchus entomophagus]